MLVMCIDLETTGLDPKVHSVTEFAAVYGDIDDPKHPVELFYRWINPDGYTWSQYCLNLHYKWIGRVNERITAKQWSEQLQEPRLCESFGQMTSHFVAWCESIGVKRNANGKMPSVTAGGKNFGSFDKRFLEESRVFPMIFKHRVADPTLKYRHPLVDKVLPDLTLCKERAIALGCTNLVPGVAHNALDDAMDVFKLLCFEIPHPLDD